MQGLRTHALVQSDNLCFADGRAVLADWNWPGPDEARSP